MLTVFSVIASLLSASATAGQRIRTVEVKKDEVVTVRTAMSVATIVQVPDRPLSLVVGDSEAFKVEYLDQAITIKPVHSGAKSNLYIYTDYRRFDVSLITTSESLADYVVYLKPKVLPPKKPAGISWMPFKKSFENDGLMISVERLGRLGSSSAFIEFKVQGKTSKKIDPGSFWLSQKSTTLPIEKLILSELEIKTGRHVVGIIEIDLSRAKIDSDIRFELRSRERSGLDLPAIKRWQL